MNHLIFASLLVLKYAFALGPFTLRSRQDTDTVAFVDPNLAGGSLIESTFNGFGESLNVNSPPTGFVDHRHS